MADALSRRAHSETMLYSISVGTPQWCQSIIDSYLSDEQAQQILAKIAVDGASVPNFSLQDGILRFHIKIWLGSSHSLHKTVIAALHSTPVGGHSCFPVTYHRVKQLFSWPGMRTAIKQFIAGCTKC